MRVAAVLVLAVPLVSLCFVLTRTAAADAAASGISACLDENGDFTTDGASNSYVFTLTNKCGKRIKCTIDAYVTGAKGADSGHGTLIIEPKAKRSASKKSFSMRVKQAAGTAQVSRGCKFL